MPGYLAASALLLCLSLVIVRVLMLRRGGTKALHFGNLDKKDYIIPPVALFYFYVVLAAAFGWPLFTAQRFFTSHVVAWAGVAVCYLGVLMLVLSLVAFGRSFRVGIDVDHPDELVTAGVFGISRNPIYLGFGLVLLGQFLVFPNWIPLAYLGVAVWLFNRQVLREEAFMREHYGQVYADYCGRVRRYL